jgi:hypothetical protein
MLTANRLKIFGYMNKCIENSRDPSKALDSEAVLEILQEVFQSVTNFENQLVSELDVD